MAAGTIFSLALSQQFDDNGDPLGACELFIYLAGTTTPATAYQTSALTSGQELPFPIVADASARIPPFWLDAANTYKARLRTSAGVLVFEYDNVPAIGPGVGGGGVDTTDPNSISSTGDFKWRAIDTTLSGWVRANGRTIGNATSGGTERANADTSDLFDYLWQNFSNTICPVSGGRGASSAADYAANKTITLLDLRGRTPFGLDSMGNSAAGRLTGTTFAVGNKDTAASTCGSNLHTLASSEVPATTVSISDPAHSHGLTNGTLVARNDGGSGITASAGVGISFDTLSVDAASTGITGTVAGGGGAHNNMVPAMLGTWYIRL